jgi:arsenate reductase
MTAPGDRATRGPEPAAQGSPGAGGAGGAPRAPERVVFACVQNAGRSQMAAALFHVLADPARARAVSAGTRPAERVHAGVVAAMRERGVDLSTARPQLLTAELARGARLLVTMGCGEECPAVPGLETLDWPLPDPHGQAPDAVAAIRDALEARVRALVAERGWGRATRPPGEPPAA